MWCVYDSSFEFDWCVAAFVSEEEANRFRRAYLLHNPDFLDDWVWLRHVDAPGPEWIDGQVYGKWTW